MRTAAVLVLLAAAVPAGAEKLNYTYMWHLEQPIYWPDQQTSGADRYERAWESIVRGGAHPSNNLSSIFGLADRVAAYQYRPKDSIGSILGYSNAGAQVSYSGGLVENIQSLGAANQLGYSPGWYNDFRTARSWTTSGGKPRCDIVNFAFHHPMCPLISDSTLRKEIQLYKAVYDDAWGSSPGVSRGFFPSEMAFSTRMIKVLDEEGIDWSFVSGEKMSRACSDFPVVYGSGGINCDPPNPADQVNPAQGSYYRVSISRGCAPAEAYPFAYTPHRAQYIDPESGQVYEIMVVPCAQAIGWEDGYAAIGTGHFDNIEPGNDPSRPMLAVMAHDGDNNWGGGYSYYMEAVPNLAGSASGAGYVPNTVEQYLANHPVPAGDVVHVEDGAWVNADGDFGSPQFWNWNWPPVNSSGQVDIPGGWAEDIRNWAVIVAAQNHVDTAEQILLDTGGSVNINKILYPDGTTNEVERAWHYFLGSLNSGYMYYGTAEDFEVKPTIACNEALQHTASVIGAGTLDQTGPSVWIPQRWPWNPGETNFGAAYGYQQTVMPTDMWVWTFVHDVSDVQSVTLYYRVDNDGTNPLASHQNETYAGGSEVGAWQTMAMTGRAFPAGNFFNDPSIDFFEMPSEIADEYYAQITGLSEVLVDYYVGAVDTKGNVTKSAIQHVWIGDGQGSGGGGSGVTITPDPAVAGQSVLVQYDASGGVLASAGTVYIHYGFNNWGTVNPTDPPMTYNAGESTWEITLSVPQSATQFDCVFNDGAGTWDNNNGQDWHFTVTGGGGGGNDWVMDGVLDAGATQIAQNGVTLWAGIQGSVLYVATDDAGEGSDHFILLAQTPGAMTNAPWAKAGLVAQWDAFLADENDNDYEGWFDAIGATQAATGANGGVLEGTIDLAGEFGSVPTEVYAAVAIYETNDGGGLLSAFQIAPTINSDGNVDAAEYQLINLCALGLDCCPADVTTTGAGVGDPGYGVPDGSVTAADINYFVNAYVAGDAGTADVTTQGAGAGDPNYGVPDGSVTAADLQYYVNLWVAGCP